MRVRSIRPAQAGMRIRELGEHDAKLSFKLPRPRGIPVDLDAVVQENLARRNGAKQTPSWCDDYTAAFKSAWRSQENLAAFMANQAKTNKKTFRKIL